MHFETNVVLNSGQKRYLQITTKISKKNTKIPNSCRQPSEVFQRWPTIELILEITWRSPKTSEDFLEVAKVLGIRKAKRSEITNCIPKSSDYWDFLRCKSKRYFKYLQVIGHNKQLSIFESATCHLLTKHRRLFNL